MNSRIQFQFRVMTMATVDHLLGNMFFITIPESLLSSVRKEVDQVVDNTTSQLAVPECRCRSPQRRYNNLLHHLIYRPVDVAVHFV
ncbi:hypothetical protein CEP52_014573 [Fusarium oligoseptatum]|uniref:Uncharacterized protein n=1 Tax=Fusarium oligoseptatum TaxID=2604345 RepID=A0A428SL91_9HYPO|nr:hypothetical protein CEP52_014573 [Fusarium oligoseptatum]